MPPRVRARGGVLGRVKELCNEFSIYRNLIKSRYDVGDFYSKEIIANKKFMTNTLPADKARIINAFVIMTATRECAVCESRADANCAIRKTIAIEISSGNLQCKVQ